MRHPISVTIITLNEEKDLPRALASAAWADEIVVIDSGSTDRTVELAKAAGARVIHNPWPGYGKQKNFAQAQAKHDWVLNIDADEEITPELRREIESVLDVGNRNDVGTGTKPSPHSINGYLIPRKTFYLGRWIRHGGWYPNYLVRLVNRTQAQWTEPEVHETLMVYGPTGTLREHLNHYTFRGIEDQVSTNVRYARYGSIELAKRGVRGGLARLLLKPWGKFLETYLWKKGCLDGFPGLIISINAAYSVFLKYAFLWEKRRNA
ncbi:MAG: glycosyltransferase family 2 protein [Bacteriovoracia bacterium]